MAFGWMTRARSLRARGGRRISPLTRLLQRSSALDPLQGSERPDATFEGIWRAGLRQRVVVMLTILGVWGLVVILRLTYLQVLQHDWYVEYADRQQQAQIELEAVRGDIVDRNGQLLAYSVESDALVANPAEIDNPRKTVAALCDALGDCPARERADLIRRLSSNKEFAYVRRSRAVTAEQLERVMRLELPGIALRGEPRRFYPKFELAAHVLGFVNLDNQGQAGIEYAYDKIVRGQKGKATAQVDGHQQRLKSRVDVPSVPGASLELTIDLGLQHIAERELKAGVEAHRARGGMVVVMQPQTGEILALASYPTFNPNAPSKYSDDARRNRAVQDVYEPGSTFKIVTAAAAIEERIVTPHQLIETSPGHITIGSRKPIYDTHNYGLMTFEDVIVKSSNVGAIKVGLQTGAEKLSRYVNRFGFGQVLAPDFVGQSRGIWNPARLDDSSLASISMGYQVSVTPLQMAAAVSSVANGGRLLEPRVIRAIVRDGKREAVQPKVLRQTITPATAETVRAMLEQVVERGTATVAKLPGYDIAGKTGTASKIVDRAYSKTDYNASFVGFAPSRHPAFTILVVIDTPRAGTYYGGSVAAPVFKRIAEGALQLAGIPPSNGPTPTIMHGDLGPVRRARATTVLPSLVPVGGPALMPDLRGLSAREAVRVMVDAGLSPRMNGTGFVARQTPAAGVPVEPGGWAAVELQRRLPDPDDQVASQ